ncbi:hypothetical protein JMA_04310 [Jeotgalibacillus malaysiensis]|uniref:Uncharacterized protein n=1 Tax=Jeotgalibacillus malaysiensis TaxID=1508404 RepID=A0A0B5AMH1_9BACL|nr:hypothetical protein [Jeotgalibacillus malaysiensis]AJD89748.1 hypothetical protein JMA_04310 [Jeotgalibacillus malaysiensis]
MKKILVILGVVAVVVIGGIIAYNVMNEEPNVQVILDHTDNTYVLPECFEQDEPSNYIEQSDMERAVELNYQPGGSCTESAVSGE